MTKYTSTLAALIVVGGCLFASLTTHAADEDWPQFRGPGGQGVSTATGLPTAWNDQENVIWKTRLPGYGASSPIAIGDRLYCTCYSGYGTNDESAELDDLRLHVVCLDRDSGDVVWQDEIEPKQPEQDSVRDHGYAAPTPACDGEGLYVFFGKTGVFRYDLEGNQLWQADVGDNTHQWGCGTSPVLFEDVVIVNASVESRSLVGLDKATGEQVWSREDMQASWNTPHLVEVGDGETELVVSIKGKVLGYDPATGESLWECAGVPDYVRPSIVSQDGIIYALGGRTSRAIAIKSGGRGDVSESHKLWEARVGANVSSPAIHDGHLYWVSDRNRIAYCVRLSDGEVIYQERFPAQPYASALIADGKVFIVTRRGGTFVLAAKPEYELLSTNELTDDTQFNASPIVAGGKLLLRSDEFLYCVGSK